MRHTDCRVRYPLCAKENLSAGFPRTPERRRGRTYVPRGGGRLLGSLNMWRTACRPLTLGVFALAMTWLCLITVRARAEDRHPQKPRLYLVLPVTRADEHLDELAAFAAEVDSSLLQQGREHLPFASAASAFEERHSQEPQPVTKEDIDLLYSESKLAATANVNRRYQEALEHARQIPAHLSDVTVSLNRSAENAREYFKGCVSSVRALVASQNLEQATSTARECRAAVPDLKPTSDFAPPPVMKIFEQIEKEKRDSMLIVESQPAGPSCTVFLEGRPLGPTPFRMGATVGDRYRVQVRCGEALPARVHTATVRATPTRVVIDTHFDMAVQTSGDILRLVYEQIDASTVPHDALAVAEALGITDVVLVDKPQHGRFGVWRVRRSQSTSRSPSTPVVDSFSISEQPSPKKLSAALAEMLDAPEASLDDAESEPFAADGSAVHKTPAHARPRHGRGPRWGMPLGLTLAAAGLVVTALEAWKFRAYLDAGTSYRELIPTTSAQYVAGYRKWQDTRTAPYAFGAASAALLSSGGALLASRLSTKPRRWVAPVVAAAGAGLLVTGALQIAQGAACSSRRPRTELAACVADQEQRDRGGLLTLAATPFVAVSTALLVQHFLGPQSPTLAVALAADHTAATAHLTLRF